MVDTIRSLSALQALLADNTSGDIEAQDVRDFLVSVFPPQYSGASVYKSTTPQTLTTGTAAAVTFNAELFDTDTYHDNSTNPSRLTVPTTGLYHVSTSILFASGGTADTKRFIHFRVNAAASPQYGVAVTHVPAGGDLATGVYTSTVLSLSASDYVEVFARQDSTGNLDVDAGATAYTMASIVRLGQAPA